MDPEQINQQGPPQGPPPTVAPPPASPPEVEQANPMAGRYVGQEHLSQLENMAEQVRGKMSEYDSGRLAGTNMLQANRNALIEQVLGVLQSAGIDISNQEQVAAYIEQLREFNPDVAELFEEFMDSLLGGGAEVEGLTEGEFAEMPGVPAPPGGEEGGVAPQPKSYEALSQNVRERLPGGGAA